MLRTQNSVMTAFLIGITKSVKQEDIIHALSSSPDLLLVNSNKAIQALGSLISHFCKLLPSTTLFLGIPWLFEQWTLCPVTSLSLPRMTVLPSAPRWNLTRANWQIFRQKWMTGTSPIGKPTEITSTTVRVAELKHRLLIIRKNLLHHYSPKNITLYREAFK